MSEEQNFKRMTSSGKHTELLFQFVGTFFDDYENFPDEVKCYIQMSFFGGLMTGFGMHHENIEGKLPDDYINEIGESLVKYWIHQADALGKIDVIKKMMNYNEPPSNQNPFTNPIH